MKRILMVCLTALCNLTLFAQIGTGPQIVHTTEKSAIRVPPQEAPAGLTSIYSNLGSSKTDLYADTGGWAVVGPNYGGENGQGQDVAMQFTPKSDSHVSRVRVAVQYAAVGPNQVNLYIVADAGGLPAGAPLAGPVTIANLPALGTCCTLAVADFSPVAVAGGTKYWVLATTPAGSNFLGAWEFVAQGKTPPLAFYLAGEWVGEEDSLQGPAGEVLGTIP